MSKLKYIVYELDCMPLIVLFDTITDHSEVARRLGVTAVSAGFVYGINEDNVSCGGESVTLKLKSREVDTKILRKLLTLG